MQNLELKSISFQYKYFFIVIHEVHMFGAS